jgi:hypothetical protein
MRQIIDSLKNILPPADFDREIAPGVHVHIRPAAQSFRLVGSASISSITHRMHDAWDSLRGKANAQQRAIQNRLANYRRAA